MKTRKRATITVTLTLAEFKRLPESIRRRIAREKGPRGVEEFSKHWSRYLCDKRAGQADMLNCDLCRGGHYCVKHS